MRRRLCLSFIFIILFCVFYNVQVSAYCPSDEEDYHYVDPDGTKHTSFSTLEEKGLEDLGHRQCFDFKVHHTYEVFNYNEYGHRVKPYYAEKDVGTFYVVRLHNSVYITSKNTADLLCGGVYDNDYTVGYGDKAFTLFKINSGTDTGVEVSSIVNAKAINLANRLGVYLGEEDLSDAMALSNDLGAGTVADGDTTGLRWWGINYDGIVDPKYKKNFIGVSPHDETVPNIHEIFITTAVPGRGGSDTKVDYKIFLPNAYIRYSDGKEESVNEDEIEAVAKFICDTGGYKYLVKKALMETTIEFGINLITYSSNNLQRANDVITVKDGAISTNNLSYSLAGFVHPGYGYMETPPENWLSDDQFARLTNIADNGTPLNSSIPIGMLNAQKVGGEQGDGVYFVPNDEYKKAKDGQGVVTGLSENSPVPTSMRNAGVQPIRQATTGATTENMRYFTTNMLKIAFPSLLSMNNNGAYTMNTSSCEFYSPPGYYYSPFTNNIYIKSDSTYINKYNLGDIGIDLSNIYIFQAAFDDNGYSITDSTSAKTGIAILSKAGEMVVAPGSGDKLFTGRFVHFNLMQGGSLSSTSSDFLSVTSWGKSDFKGIPLKYISFPNNVSSVMSAESHKVPAEGTNVRLFYDIISLTDEPIASTKKPFFAVVRNNVYIDDTDLLSWVDGGDIQGAPVDSDRLQALLKGGLSTGAEKIDYVTWKTMQSIKQQLEDYKRGSLQKYITVPTMVFGVFLIIYGILLVIAYWIDVMNVFSDMSILNLMTGKKVYPVTDAEEAKYYNMGEKVKYVTFSWVVKRFILCTIVGVLFINYMTLLQLLLNVFAWVGQITGGIIK